MSNDELRVSTLELFFDLVFVFTITQLTAVLVAKPTGESLAQVVLMLTAIWWMYGAFAWLTNAVPPDRTALRLPLLAGMLAFFAISLTIPTAFGENGVVFACAYLVVIAVHTVLYMQAAGWTVAGVWSFARMNMVAGTLILVGAIIGGATEYALWSVAVAIFALVPALVPEEAGWLRPPHFVGRHGLVVMVGRGGSVVAISIISAE
jgi:low temperature requirement protein LtrA